MRPERAGHTAKDQLLVLGSHTRLLLHFVHQISDHRWSFQMKMNVESIRTYNTHHVLRLATRPAAYHAELRRAEYDSDS